jgi:hypothetical protein
MTSIGISRLVVSKNHVENSVAAIYDRHSYDKEKNGLWKYGDQNSAIP